MKRIIIVLLIINIIPIISYSMENKPYHHLSDGTFRNPEGSPQRDSSFNWSFKIFNAEKKKLNMEVPKDHVIKKDLVLESLKKYRNDKKLAEKYNNITINYDVKKKYISVLYFLNDVKIAKHIQVPISKKKTDGPYGPNKPYIKIGIYRIGETGTTSFAYNNLLVKNK